MKAEEIEQFETEGFVMSGSRHKRMNAVRIRKENQVTKLSDKTKLNVVSGSRHKTKLIDNTNTGILGRGEASPGDVQLNPL